MQNHFRLEVRSDDRATVIAVSGELDLASSPTLEQELKRVNGSDTELVILDLRELKFMDSTGLGVLVKANQHAQDTGKRFGLVKGSPQVQRLLSLTGIDERITVAEAPEELLG